MIFLLPHQSRMTSLAGTTTVMSFVRSMSWSPWGSRWRSLSFSWAFREKSHAIRRGPKIDPLRCL